MQFRIGNFIYRTIHWRFYHFQSDSKNRKRTMPQEQSGSEILNQNVVIQRRALFTIVSRKIHSTEIAAEFIISFLIRSTCPYVSRQNNNSSRLEYPIKFNCVTKGAHPNPRNKISYRKKINPP